MAKRNRIFSDWFSTPNMKYTDIIEDFTNEMSKKIDVMFIDDSFHNQLSGEDMLSITILVVFCLFWPWTVGLWDFYFRLLLGHLHYGMLLRTHVIATCPLRMVYHILSSHLTYFFYSFIAHHVSLKQKKSQWNWNGVFLFTLYCIAFRLSTRSQEFCYFLCSAKLAGQAGEVSQESLSRMYYWCMFQGNSLSRSHCSWLFHFIVFPGHCVIWTCMLIYSLLLFSA